MPSSKSLIIFPLCCFFGLLILSTLQVSDAQTGVCYGRLGSIPNTSEVIELYKRNNIRRMRLYDPHNKDVLVALGNSDIEVIIGVPNENDLEFVASSKQNAQLWVQDNILNYYPSVNFTYIAVGNEVSPLIGDKSQYVRYVVQAMNNVQAAISSANLGGKIKVSTALEMGLTENTYPPSKGSFKSGALDYVRGIVTFLRDNNSPLLMNIYPYFALQDQPSIGLDYALFRSPGIDTPDGKYQNLFHAMLDAVYAALDKVGASSMKIVVSETGWPTQGGHETTINNAMTYNSKLIQTVKHGSPRRPDGAIETYIFAMFDEDQKDSDLERHWGLFTATGQSKYSISFD